MTQLVNNSLAEWTENVRTAEVVCLVAYSASNVLPEIGRPRAVGVAGVDRRAHEQILSKLRGVLQRMDGPTALVSLVKANSNDAYRYALPSDLLLDAVVTLENQPFELIQGKRWIRPGKSERFATVRALAPSDSAETEPVPLDDEYKSKLFETLASLRAERGGQRASDTIS